MGRRVRRGGSRRQPRRLRRALEARGRDDARGGRRRPARGAPRRTSAVWHGAARRRGRRPRAGRVIGRWNELAKDGEGPPGIEVGDRLRRRDHVVGRARAVGRRRRGAGRATGKHLPSRTTRGRSPRSGRSRRTMRSRRRSPTAGRPRAPERRAVPRRRGGARAEHVRARRPGPHRALPSRGRPVDQPVGPGADQPRRRWSRSSRRSTRRPAGRCSWRSTRSSPTTHTPSRSSGCRPTGPTGRASTWTSKEANVFHLDAEGSAYEFWGVAEDQAAINTFWT